MKGNSAHGAYRVRVRNRQSIYQLFNKSKVTVLTYWLQIFVNFATRMIDYWWYFQIFNFQKKIGKLKSSITVSGDHSFFIIDPSTAEPLEWNRVY